MAETPTPALAVPYAAPKQAKTMAEVQPIAPKNGYQLSVLLVVRASWFCSMKLRLMQEVRGRRGAEGSMRRSASWQSRTYSIDGAASVALANALCRQRWQSCPNASRGRGRPSLSPKKQAGAAWSQSRGAPYRLTRVPKPFWRR